MQSLLHPLHAARRSSLFRAVIRQLDVPLFRSLQGFPFPVCMRLGPNLATWLSGRVTETAEMALFEQLIEVLDASRFVDVGANVGLYSFRFVARRPRGQALALEPDPANVNCLAKTIRRSCLSGVEVRVVAAGDLKGQAVFQFDDVAGVTGQLKSEIASFVQRHYGLRPREDLVAVDTLDAIVGDLRPDIIKIDVEGAEAKVLRGAQRLLNEARPCLLIELGKGRGPGTDLLERAKYSLYDARTLGPLVAESWNVLGLPAERAPAIVSRLVSGPAGAAARPHG